MALERPIIMPPKDFYLFQKLQAEVGGISTLQVTQSPDADHWYNSDFISSEMAVRVAIRGEVLKRLGYKDDEQDPTQRASDNPEVTSLLGDPNYFHYKWQNVSVKNLGIFSNMGVGNGALVDVRKGIVLFTDEVQKLLAGESVTTFHYSGFQQTGFLVETKEIFKVIDGDLQRVVGQIID